MKSEKKTRSGHKVSTQRSRTKDSTMRVPLSRLFSLDLDLKTNGDRPQKPFEQSEYVFICIDAIVKAARSIPMVFSTANDDIVESGPAYDLLFKSQPFSKFITETAGYLALYRECYWILADQDIQKPTKIIVAGPEQVKPVITNGILVGYKLQTTNGTPIPLLLDDVWPLIDFNPDSRYHGVGPATAGKLAISTAYQAALMNEATLSNGGKLSGLIVLPQGVKLEPEEREAILSKFENKHKGARNAGKWALMTGGADVKTLAQTMADLQMTELMKSSAGTICALFGVPQEVVNLNSEAQYAHGPAQQRFILNTIAPMLSFISENITIGLLNRFRFQKQIGVGLEKAVTFCGRSRVLKLYPTFRAAKTKAIQAQQNLFAWFNVEEHPTIQEMLRERTSKVLDYGKAGIPLNQIIDAYDLPFEHVPWGDDFLVPAGLVPARYIIEAGLEGLIGPSLPEGQEVPPDEEEDKKDFEPLPAGTDDLTTKADDLKRLRIWKNWVMSWAGLEKEYTAAMRQLFVRQSRILTDKLRAALKDSDKAVKANTDEVVARVVFDFKLENGKIHIINNTFFERGSELGLRQVLSETLGLSGQALTDTVEQAKNVYAQAIRRSLLVSSQKITSVNRVTQEAVARQLRRGLEAGEGLVDLSKRIAKVLGSNVKRSLSIARTQTAGAIDSGRHTGMKQAGIEKRSWITAGDDTVRVAHVEAGQKYKDGLPIDQPFEVGGEMLMYPGDPSGSAANIINCRCLEIARALGGKSFNLDYYCNVKFYSYSDMITKTQGISNG